MVVLAPEVRDAFERLMRSRRWFARRERRDAAGQLAGLGRTGQREAIVALGKAARTSNQRDVIALTVSALGDLATGQGLALAELLELADSRHREARDLAQRALSRLGSEKATGAVLLRHLEAAEQVRPAAMRLALTLVDSPDGVGVQCVLRTLQRDPSCVAAVSRYVQALDEPAQRDVVRRLRASATEPTSAAAIVPVVAELAAGGSTEALQELLDGILEPTAGEDGACLQALEAFWPEAPAAQLDWMQERVMQLAAHPDLPRLLDVVLTARSTHLFAALLSQWRQEPTVPLGQALYAHGRLLAADVRFEVEVVVTPQAVAEVADEVLVRRLLGVRADLSQYAERVLLSLPGKEGREALCRLAVYEDDGRALEIARRAGYAPATVRDQVVFYVLIGRAEELRVLDPDSTVLRAVYVREPSLRSRITRSLREQRRSDMLVALAIPQSNAALAPDHFNSIAAELIEAHAWPELLRLALMAPPRNGVGWVCQIADSAWEPRGEDEALMSELVPIARALSVHEPPASHHRRQLPFATIEVDQGAITELDFLPGSDAIVVATSDGTLECWNPKLVRTEWSLALDGSIQAIAGMGGGRVAVSSLSAGKRAALMFLSRGEQRWESHPRSAITSMRAIGDDALIAGHVDGSLSRFSTDPRRPAKWARSYQSTVRTLAVDTESKWAVAVCEHGASTVRAQTLTGMRTHGTRFQLSAAAIASDGTFAIGGQDGRVRVLSREPPPQRRRRSAFTQLNASVLALGFLVDDRELLIITDVDVRVMMWEHGTNTTDRFATGTVGLRPTSAAFSSECGMLALGFSDGRVALWHILAREATAMLTRPLIHASPRALDIASRLKHTTDGSLSPWFAWCEIALRTRFRHAIGLTDSSPVATGAFDIHL